MLGGQRRRRRVVFVPASGGAAGAAAEPRPAWRGAGPTVRTRRPSVATRCSAAFAPVRRARCLALVSGALSQFRRLRTRRAPVSAVWFT